MIYNWIESNSTCKDEEILTLQKELNDIPLSLSKILVNRGIKSLDDAKAFFRPELKNIHSPFLMKNMNTASKRVIKSLENNEKILIYGDYDVDGTTSVALFYSFLLTQTEEKNHKNIHYYIPDRYNEGYGVSDQGVNYAINNNFNLVITLDCGIKALNTINKLQANKIDVIVCDHHLPGNELPKAFAILDPKQHDCKYPYKELSGCGVGFKLAQAILETQEKSTKNLFQFLDYCAISIAADIVDMNGENRILSYHGLKLLNTDTRIGLKQVLKRGEQNVSEIINSDIVFKIAPRINAAGRINDAKDAVKLLIVNETNKANDLAFQIEEYNKLRKELEKDASSEALALIKEKQLENNASTVIYSDEWHKGVIGIVASRLIENYHRPTIVITKSGEKYAGSARSVDGYDVYKAIDACSEHLEQFGGHPAAAGLTIKPENLDKFSNAFEKYVKETISLKQKTPEIIIDSELNFNEIWDNHCESQKSYPKFYRILSQMEPFGPGNLNPIFYSDEVKSVYPPKVVGEKHLKLHLTQNSTLGIGFDAIAFNALDKFDLVEIGKTFKIVYHVETNEWNQKKKIQLRILDIKPNN